MAWAKGWPWFIAVMRVLLASSEVYPYSKSGGLADMVSALAKALGRAGHRVGLVTPLYRGIRERFPLQWLDYYLDLPHGPSRARSEEHTSELQSLRHLV